MHRREFAAEEEGDAELRELRKIWWEVVEWIHPRVEELEVLHLADFVGQAGKPMLYIYVSS